MKPKMIDRGSWILVLPPEPDGLLEGLKRQAIDALESRMIPGAERVFVSVEPETLLRLIDGAREPRWAPEGAADGHAPYPASKEEILKVVKRLQAADEKLNQLLAIVYDP